MLEDMTSTQWTLSKSKHTPNQANSWHLKAFESGWGYRFNQSVEYLLKAAKANLEEFTKILGIYTPWYEDKKRKGKKKNLPSQKVIEGFRSRVMKIEIQYLKAEIFAK